MPEIAANIHDIYRDTDSTCVASVFVATSHTLLYIYHHCQPHTVCPETQLTWQIQCHSMANTIPLHYVCVAWSSNMWYMMVTLVIDRTVTSVMQ